MFHWYFHWIPSVTFWSGNLFIIYFTYLLFFFITLNNPRFSKVKWSAQSRVTIEWHGWDLNPGLPYLKLMPWRPHATASSKAEEALVLCIAFSAGGHWGRENVTFTCQRSCWEIYSQRGKGKSRSSGKEGLEMKSVGQYCLPTCLSMGPCSLLESVSSPPPPCSFFAPLKESSLIFCETQHLLSVPALQLIIPMNTSRWRPDMLQFKDHSPSVYEPFHKTGNGLFFLNSCPWINLLAKNHTVCSCYLF